jgi:hypothetical protein
VEQNNKKTTDTKGIQAPGVALTHETENAAKIIGKHYAREPRTVDEPRGLKNFLILRGEFQFTLRVAQRNFIRVCPGIALINLKEFNGNILNMGINDRLSRQKIKNLRCGCG